MVDVSNNQQQALIDKQNRVRQNQTKKQLCLVSMLSLLTFICFIFAMSFYQWIWVQFDLHNSRFDSKTYFFWVNLLYIKQDSQDSSYKTFNQAQKQICINNIYCTALFYQFRFTGYLCFAIFSLAIATQLFQISRMVYYMFTMGKIVQAKKNFRHMVEICTYIVGLTLSAFSIWQMEGIANYHFGISYWLCVCTLAIFIIIVIYGQISIKKMLKEAIIENLLTKQKQVRSEKMKIDQNQQRQTWKQHLLPSL